MISGHVNAKLQSLVTITVRGQQNTEQTLVARLDTGFNGGLTLPPDVVSSLGLTADFLNAIVLANGEQIDLATYRALLVVDGVEHRIPVFATGDFPLLGMLPLVGFQISIDMRPDGIVIIGKAVDSSPTEPHSC